MQVAREPQQGVHSGETHGQRTHPDKSFPRNRACSYIDSPLDRLHEPHVPFLRGWRTHVADAVSSSSSCFSIGTRTFSLLSYPSMPKQERPEKFPNSVTFDTAGEPLLTLRIGKR